MDATLIPVILSGGSGTRLWPVSRESHPKPFITLPDGQSLLQKTFLRACQFVHAPEMITITNKEYYLKSKAEYQNAPDNAPKQTFILEPFARNTAPAIALAAMKIAAQYGREAVMLILPADHLITPLDAFTTTCLRAVELANQGNLVTFGIKPNAPETGYGYIECGAELNKDVNCHRVNRFIEKPSITAAEKYVANQQYLWNSGMFCFQVGKILDQFAALAPALYAAITQCWQQTCRHINNESVITLDETSFAELENISIDYAIMEKSADIAVITSHFEWRDIGSWEAYHKLFQADHDGNTILGDAILIDSKNNFIHSQGRMVASIGINNLAIIDTPDAMLITQLDRTQDVRQVVQALKLSAHESYATHRTVIRPWGSYTVLEEGPCFKIKRITVSPGAALSLQKHNRRSEHWVVVSGQAKIIVGEKTFLLTTNESTFVPMNTPHRLSNPATEPLIIIEVQTGDYLGEDDIVRMEDTYGRV